MNQQEMKEENKKKIFFEILSCPGISRIELAKKCCYSKTTVSILVDELIREGYVQDSGTTTNKERTQGRRPTSLFPNTERYSIVVVNLDKKFVQIANADLSTQLRCVREFASKESEDSQAEIFRHLQDYISEECERTYILAICWILPAMIDREHGQLISDVLEKSITEDFFKRVEQRFPYTRHFYFNDTACLAYAEKGCGYFPSGEDFVYINMNEGVGAAFVLNGNLLGGPVGLMTQFGSISLGREKGNQKYRCLENEIGEKGIRQRFLELEQKYHLEEKDEVSDQFSFGDIERLALQGNKAAKEMLDDMAADMSYALGNLITILHVKRIVIGGSGRELGSYFLDCIRRDIIGIGFWQFVKNTEIVYSGLDQYAALSGAVQYFLDQYFEFVALNEQEETG